VKRLRLICASLLAACAVVHAAAPVPRPAPEFKIHQPSGETLLPTQKGKVSVVQFLFTGCGHCQATAQWLSKMQADLGPKGLLVQGVAFNDEVLTKDNTANSKAIAAFSQFASFPVGIAASQESVLRFLGLSVVESYGVPQLVVIDKKGVIRAQTPPRPVAGTIVQESVMRELVLKLLGEK
jgi:thiol-disulfide isomerase/thioredoxin